MQRFNTAKCVKCRQEPWYHSIRRATGEWFTATFPPAPIKPHGFELGR